MRRWHEWAGDWRVIAVAVALLGWAVAGWSTRLLPLGALLIAPIVCWVLLARSRTIGIAVAIVLTALLWITATTAALGHDPRWPLAEEDVAVLFGPCSLTAILVGVWLDGRQVRASAPRSRAPRWAGLALAWTGIALTVLCCPAIGLFANEVAGSPVEVLHSLPDGVRIKSARSDCGATAHFCGAYIEVAGPTEKLVAVLRSRGWQMPSDCHTKGFFTQTETCIEVRGSRIYISYERV